MEEIKEELEAAKLEATESNEFTELEEKDLKAVSGGCGTSTPEPYTYCTWCKKPMYYEPKHYTHNKKTLQYEPWCDGCYEEQKNVNWNWCE